MGNTSIWSGPITRSSASSTAGASSRSSQTASIAAVAVVFVEYGVGFVPLGPVAAKAAVVILILGLSLWNCRSVRASADTQNLTTVAKLVMAGAIVVLCVSLGDQSVET